MNRTELEIKKMKEKYNSMDTISKNDSAALQVLNENLSEEQIENRFYDELNPWIERTAISMREWMDGLIEEDEIL